MLNKLMDIRAEACEMHDYYRRNYLVNVLGPKIKKAAANGLRFVDDSMTYLTEEDIALLRQAGFRVYVGSSSVSIMGWADE